MYDLDNVFPLRHGSNTLGNGSASARRMRLMSPHTGVAAGQILPNGADDFVANSFLDSLEM